MKFIVTLQPGEDGWIVAECPSLPGCVSQGHTVDEAMANIREAIEVSLETRRDLGVKTELQIVEVEITIPTQTL
jgi:predicted RNase H-like HicB family nuclease